MKVQPPDFSNRDVFLPISFIEEGNYNDGFNIINPFFKRGGVVKKTSLLWLRLEVAIKIYGYVELDGKMLGLHKYGITIGDVREDSTWGGDSLHDYEYFIYKNEFIIQPTISDVCKIYKILSNYEVPKDIETLSLLKLAI